MTLVVYKCFQFAQAKILLFVKGLIFYICDFLTGMSFEGSPHSGLDDSLNIARIAISLLNDGCALNINERLHLQHNICEPNPEVRYIPVKQASDENSNSDNEDCNDNPNQESFSVDSKIKRSSRSKRGLVDSLEDLTTSEKNPLDEDGLGEFVSFYQKYKS